ncbi:MAG: CHAD domain-containing protein, partial [Chloroflexi bacterium]|nr:CHAD domain-containing protein [Chloroflexota bacterium]
RMTARPVELELKYRVTDPTTGERLIGAERLAELAASGSPRTTQLEDRYVDTGDGALARAGFAVRLRQSGAGTVVSVKSLARTEGPGGAVRREELEGPADRVAAAVEWPPSDARSLVLEHAGDAPLVERVTVRQLRRKRVLRSGPTRVELSLDEVDVVARGRIVGRFLELEAELLKGPEEALAGLGAVLDAEVGLRRSRSSKLEAALGALDGTAEIEPSGELPTAADLPSRDASDAAPGRLVVGKAPGVTADDHIAEAGRKVMRFHLARMLDYEAGTRSGLDSEDVHKMRVATRRQRAAWRVFGEAFRPGRTKRYRKGLREIAGRLGAVRDLDVQLEAADAYRADLPVAEQRALEPLMNAWRSHREDARVLLLRELDADGFRRWVDEYRDFVRTEGAQVLAVGPVQPHRVRDTAPSRIWAAYEAVRGYEPVLRWADVETLHELRIAGKWLRYTLEFVREALGPGSAPLIARVTTMQDHLGLLNDADVTASMARTFLVEHAGELSGLESAAIGRYLVDRERAVARLRRTIGPTWRGITGPAYRRALGRVVAGL